MPTAFTNNAKQQIDVKVYGNNGNVNVLRQIPRHAQTVLDIGCGRGDNAQHLKTRGMAVDGISISEQEIVLATPHLRKGYLFNVEKGLPEEVKLKKYDIVICSHVIEHVQYPEQLLEDIGAIMTPQSIFIMALPNIMHYKSRWELIKGNFNYQTSGIWDNTHVKWYTYNSGIQLLSENGFEVLKADVTGTIPFLSLFRRLPGKVQKGIFNALKHISRGFFGYELLYVSKIKTTA